MTLHYDQVINPRRRYDNYIPNTEAPQYTRQMLTIKGEIDSNTKIVGGSNTSLSSMDRSSRQKINQENTGLK